MSIDGSTENFNPYAVYLLGEQYKTLSNSSPDWYVVRNLQGMEVVAGMGDCN